MAMMVPALLILTPFPCLRVCWLMVCQVCLAFNASLHLQAASSAWTPKHPFTQQPTQDDPANNKLPRRADPRVTSALDFLKLFLG